MASTSSSVELGAVPRKSPPKSICFDPDSGRLNELGYKQELNRKILVASNFAFSFCVVSVLTGVTATYTEALAYGGPASMTIGWFVVAFFTGCTALSMAEICSAYPVAGGPYFWTALLAGRRWAPVSAWTTGWLIMKGQWASTTAINYGLATLIKTIILLSTGGANGGGYLASKYLVLAIFAAILILQGLINCLPIKYVSKFAYIGAIWNVAAVSILVIIIPAVATQRASLDYMFTYTNTENRATGQSKFYIFLAGMVVSQYVLKGYDVSAHMSEETRRAAKNGPMAIITSVGLAIIFGWVYIVAIAIAVPQNALLKLISPKNNAGGYAIGQLFYQIFEERFGSGDGGIVCLIVLAVAMFFCGLASLASNSRTAYALSRDGALKLSKHWYKLSKHNVPVNAVWLSVGFAFVLASTSLIRNTFQALVSISTIAMYTSYAIPIFYRVTVSQKSFVPGPFSLGKFSIILGWISVLWAVAITVLFCLPLGYPLQVLYFENSFVIVAILIIISLSWYLTGRKWYKGPKRNVDVDLELEECKASSSTTSTA